MAEQLKVGFAMLASENEGRDVIELGSQATLSNLALAGLAIVFCLERNTILDRAGNGLIVMLCNPFGAATRH